MMNVSAMGMTETPSFKADGASPASNDGAAFGRLFAQRMDDGAKSDVPAHAEGPHKAGKEPPKAVTNGTHPATQDSSADTTGQANVPTDADRGFSVAVSQEMFAGATSTPPSGTGDDGTGTTAVDTGDKNPMDPIGNDLAAQLALVSQWAALTPATAATDPSAGGDIKAKLDAVRGKAAIVAALAKDVGAEKKDADAAAQVFGEATATIDAALAKVEAIGAHAQGGVTGMANACMANAFATQVAATVAPSASAAAPSIALHEQVGTTAWAHEVGSATLRMATGDLQSASLRLAPEHLGPVDVQLRIDNGVANVTFNASHAETRQALEASRTTLDQMFSDQGLRLGDCAVGDFASSRQGFEANTAQREGGNRAANGGPPDGDASPSTVTTRLTRALGLVDTFA